MPIGITVHLLQFDISIGSILVAKAQKKKIWFVQNAEKVFALRVLFARVVNTNDTEMGGHGSVCHSMQWGG